MIRFIANRILQAVTVLFLIAALTFFMVRLAPGGPFDAERDIPEAVKERIEAHYGLRDPLLVQFGNYLGNVLQGNLGPVFTAESRTVNEIIATTFPVSLQLGLLALLIALSLGVPAGILAGVRQNGPLDYLPMSAAMIGICLPTFIMGPILQIVFALKLGWFRVSGLESAPRDLFLPALTLGLYYAAYVARLTRGGMLEILHQDFIRTARAKGLPGTTIVLKHALRGGLLPVVSFLGPALAGLISGSFVVETIFNIPGLGRQFVTAAFNRDYFLILGTVLVYAVLIVGMNIVVDLAQAWLNPRQRLE